MTIEYKRHGRRIAAVKFIVRIVNGSDEGISRLHKAGNKALMDRMVNEFGIKSEKAKQVIETHSPAQIIENLNIVEQDMKEGRVKENLAGYTLTAIKEDFRKDRKPKNKSIPIYEGMRVIYQNNEYIVDSGLSIHLENGTVMSEGTIYEKIQSGSMRVLELLLYPGIKVLVDGNLYTIKNAYGEPVVNEEEIYLSEKQLKNGIKSREYTIIEYPELEIVD